MNGTFDIGAIQRALPLLSDLFQRDGHEVKRAGHAMFFCCPFHAEKSPSCQVNDDTGKFHCFGCGEGGDTFDYWQKSRGLDFREALAELASLAGIAAGGTTAPLPLAPKPKVPEKEADPLTGILHDQWTHATAALRDSPVAIERIARWRGIDPACIAWAAARGIMGLFPYSGAEREAFLVERPHDSSLLPISVHVRLGPQTQGNPYDKASCRFTPSGVGAWPFVIGDLGRAKYIFLMEGQWDALALVSVMGWHRKDDWPDVAIAGLRGATVHPAFLKHPLNPKARIFAFADADGAGAKWFEPDGLLDKLHTRVRHVTGFWPNTEKADFNDLVKAGEVTRDLLLSHFLPLMPSRHERPRGPTFARWCRESRYRLEGGLLRAANHLLADKTKPAGRRPLPAWEKHWKHSGVPPDLFLELGVLWNTYRTECLS
jgi:hypothetical protein